MIAYVAFVAVANLLLGMLLARLLASAPPQPQPTVRAPEPLDRKVVLPRSSVIRIEPVGPEPLTPVAKKDEEETQRKEHHAPPAALKTWADFAQQLRDVKERTRYCRPAQNMKLARQAAEQLKGCAKSGTDNSKSACSARRSTRPRRR